MAEEALTHAPNPFHRIACRAVQIPTKLYIDRLIKNGTVPDNSRSFYKSLMTGNLGTAYSVLSTLLLEHTNRIAQDTFHENLDSLTRQKQLDLMKVSLIYFPIEVALTTLFGKARAKNTLINVGAQETVTNWFKPPVA